MAVADTELNELLNYAVPLVSEEFEVQAMEGVRENWKAEILSHISCQKQMETFVVNYKQRTGETLNLKLKKQSTPKSIYEVRSTYRCHHDTRYKKTRDAKGILSEHPSKRFQNTYYPFQIKFKVYKTGLAPRMNYPCVIILENNHKHPTQSLEATSFWDLTDLVKEKVSSLFELGMIPSLAYKEFLQNVRKGCDDELMFYKQKADLSLCPWRRDFNFLYSQFCKEKFDGKNGVDMFDKMELKIKEYLNEYKDTRINY